MRSKTPSPSRKYRRPGGRERARGRGQRGRPEVSTMTTARFRPLGAEIPDELGLRPALAHQAMTVMSPRFRARTSRAVSLSDAGTGEGPGAGPCRRSAGAIARTPVPPGGGCVRGSSGCGGRADGLSADASGGRRRSGSPGRRGRAAAADRDAPDAGRWMTSRRGVPCSSPSGSERHVLRKPTTAGHGAP